MSLCVTMVPSMLPMQTNMRRCYMAMMDDMKDKAKDVMNDPDKRDQIQQMAIDQGISIEEAKQKFMGNEPQNP